MSEPLDRKELGHYQKRAEKKDNAEIIIDEKPMKDVDAIKIKTMGGRGLRLFYVKINNPSQKCSNAL